MRLLLVQAARLFDSPWGLRSGTAEEGFGSVQVQHRLIWLKTKGAQWHDEAEGGKAEKTRAKEAREAIKNDANKEAREGMQNPQLVCFFSRRTCFF
jgi:hypothetical protein